MAAPEFREGRQIATVPIVDEDLERMLEMEYVLGGVAILALIATVVGAMTGRIRMSCCSVTDPARDLRMRAAFEPDQGSGTTPDRRRT